MLFDSKNMVNGFQRSCHRHHASLLNKQKTELVIFFFIHFTASFPLSSMKRTEKYSKHLSMEFSNKKERQIPTI
jgi:hypothetical protein